jgi:nicotinamidase/pyrazinamidase
MKEERVLVVVDVQNDFLKGGSLEVPEGNEVIPVINQILDKYSLVIFTQDFHPSDHKSFASQHPEKKPFDIIDLNGLEQVLWPDHCVQGTPGCDLSKDLDMGKLSEKFYIFKKGMYSVVDSYSAFWDNGKRNSTGLTEFLKEREISEVDVCGLATDFCVKYTALDSQNEGFKTRVIWDACRGISEDQTPTTDELWDAGIVLIDSEYLKNE